ncbi:MAG: hypothetical protein MK294_07790, partial [Rhodospirillales bacterium]|nr:hypothetical protein [Rhodospirillales bacterium]
HLKFFAVGPVRFRDDKMKYWYIVFQMPVFWQATTFKKMFVSFVLWEPERAVRTGNEISGTGPALSL